MKSENKFKLQINNFVYKIDNAINSFRFNVAIANFYEVYKIIREGIESKKLSKKVITENMSKVMKLMIPFTPHLAYESLEFLKCKNINQWPKIEKDNIFKQVKFAVQINGKTRDILEIEKDLNEDEVTKVVLNVSKANKYLQNKKIIKLYL